MTCSPARLAANRANAQKSTGPRTPEGKVKSRANGLKHGLCAAVVVPEDLEVVQSRSAEWYYTLKPQTEYHAWLVDKITVYSLRIDRAERMERRLRDRESMAAELTWDDDRRLEAEKLGARIAHRPPQIVEELRRFPAGCDWLISRWSMLARLAEVHGGDWTPDQTNLAFHLLGTPPELRDGLRPGQTLGPDGRLIEAETVDDLASLARRESAELLERRESVKDLDEVNQALTGADLLDESNVELKRVRRHESTLYNRLRWCFKQFHYVSPHLRPHPDLKAPWSLTPRREPAETAPAVTQTEPTTPSQAIIAPEPTSEAKKGKFEAWMARPPHPPFCLEPDEIPDDRSTIDVGAIAISRELKRQQKAEAARDARRRRLEKRRA